MHSDAPIAAQTLPIGRAFAFTFPLPFASRSYNNMPRSGGRSGGGSRPSAGSSRSASTSSGPGHRAPAPAPAQRAPVPTQQQAASQVPAAHQPAGRQPGMMGQMAANMGSVAAGSVIGHGISNMLFGGRSSEAAPAAPADPQYQSFEQREAGGACAYQAKDFTQCLNATNNDMSSCGYYLEQLKQCQQAASQY